MADFFAAASDLDRILDEFEETEIPSKPQTKVVKNSAPIKQQKQNLKIISPKKENKKKILKPIETEMLIDFSTPEHHIPPQKNIPSLKNVPPQNDLDMLLSLSENDIETIITNNNYSSTNKDNGFYSNDHTNKAFVSDKSNIMIPEPKTQENLKTNKMNQQNIGTVNNDYLNKSKVVVTSSNNKDVQSNTNIQLEEKNKNQPGKNLQNEKVSISNKVGFDEEFDVDQAEFDEFMAETSAYSDQILNNMTSQLPDITLQTNKSTVTSQQPFIASQNSPSKLEKEKPLITSHKDMSKTSVTSYNNICTMTSQTTPTTSQITPITSQATSVTSETTSMTSENSIDTHTNDISPERKVSITSQIVKDLRKNEIEIENNSHDSLTQTQLVQQHKHQIDVNTTNINESSTNIDGNLIEQPGSVATLFDDNSQTINIENDQPITVDPALEGKNSNSTSPQHQAGESSNPTSPQHQAGESSYPTSPQHQAGKSSNPTSPQHQAGESSYPTSPQHQAGESSNPTSPQHQAGESFNPTSPQHQAGESSYPTSPQHQAGESSHPTSPQHQAGVSSYQTSPQHQAGESSYPTSSQHQASESSYPNVAPPSYSAVIAEDYSAGTRVDQEPSSSAETSQPNVLLEESENQTTNNEPTRTEPSTTETPSTSGEPVNGSLITRPGHTKPHWIPDDQSLVCTKCQTKFSFTKRRHHCRACGQIFCNNCCNLRSRLEYLEFTEARVCVTCFNSIVQADTLQAEANLRQQLSLNPTTSGTSSAPRPVLKNSDDSSGSSTPKSVRFFDGTRPDHPATLPDTPPPPSRLARGIKSRQRNGNTAASLYPPIIAGYDDEGGYIVDEHSELNELERMLRTQDGVVFLLSPNLFVLLKIINYAGSQCSYFTSVGLDLVGQSEVGLIIASQTLIPLQAFTLYAHLFNQARKGKAVHSMDFLLISDFIDSTNPTLFGSKEYSGILFLRRTLQDDTNLRNDVLCERLHLASNTTTFSSMLFGLLVHKHETPWAKLFPPRLLLGLGAKYKQYPYPLTNHENRDEVYKDVNNTILAILCDCRNYKYKVVVVPGLSVVVTDSNVVVSIPCNRFSDMIKIMNSSNEHVLAFGSDNISSEQFTSHLSAIQDKSEHTYTTQVISGAKDNKNEAGAAFVVFNGSLKTGSTQQAKCTVVEDGVMIQLLPERMLTLKESLRSMDDHRIRCDSSNHNSPTQENNDVGRSVEIRWISDDTKFNIGLLSPIDFRSFEGVIGYNVQGKSEKKAKQHLLRWNQVFFFKSTSDVMDMSRLAEQVANGCFQALVPHTKTLREAGQIKVGVRVNIHPDDVGYSVGSKGLPLPDPCLNSLDDNLISLIHENSGSLGADEDPVEFELIFSVLEMRSSWRTT